MMRKLTVIVLSGVICLLVAASVLAIEYIEAPMLKVKVAAGELPPIEERLPKVPRVAINLAPEDQLKQEIGRLGGTLRVLQTSPNSSSEIFYLNHEELLGSQDLNATNVVGNILEGFEASMDYRSFTFKMREGLKWSDGMPVTTEDVRFAYEDVMLNEKLTPILPDYLRDGSTATGEPMKLEIIDAYTFRVTFPNPYGGFLAQLTRIFWRGYTDLLKPKHFLMQFHTSYTPMEKIEPLLEEEGLTEWWAVFNLKDITDWEVYHTGATGFPCVRPWLPVERTSEVVIYERNPYYFKVDAAGNQLPYIDRIESTVIRDKEVGNLKAMAGELDYLYNYASIDKLPLYKANEEQGDYVTRVYGAHMVPAIYFNQTLDDPGWREVVRDVRFRKAVNMAINRERLIDTFELGFASPPTRIPSAFDPERAEKLLDEMGLDKRDGDGWRLRPDGKRLEIFFENNARVPMILERCELVIEDLKEVGIMVTMKGIDQVLWQDRIAENQIQATSTWSHSPEWWAYNWKQFGFANAAPLWQAWWITRLDEDSEVAREEPPPHVKRMISITEELLVVASEDRQELMDEWWDFMSENLYWIDLIDAQAQPLLASAKLANVMENSPSNFTLFNGEIWFFKK